MRTQIQMYEYLLKKLPSHNVEMVGNKIIAKKLIMSRSFSNFSINYLKNGQVSLSIMVKSAKTIRYSDDEILFRNMGSFSLIN